jgi:hypothetical protein
MHGLYCLIWDILLGTICVVISFLFSFSPPVLVCNVPRPCSGFSNCFLFLKDKYANLYSVVLYLCRRLLVLNIESTQCLMGVCLATIG